MKKFLKSLKPVAIRVVSAASMLLLIVATLGVSSTLYERYFYGYLGSSVVKITKTDKGLSGGTGFVVKAPSGKLYTLTNEHICSMGDNLVAHTQNGKKHKIKVIKKYKDHDLCIMEAVPGLRPFKIAKNIILHERVWLIGHPALRPLTLESGHYVGSFDIKLRSTCPVEVQKMIKEKYDKGILTAQELYSIVYTYCTKELESQHISNIAYGGNSGSPVVDMFGNVIGVLYAGRRDQPTASHTVPLKEIIKFLRNK